MTAELHPHESIQDCCRLHCQHDLLSLGPLLLNVFAFRSRYYVGLWNSLVLSRFFRALLVWSVVISLGLHKFVKVLRKTCTWAWQSSAEQNFLWNCLTLAFKCWPIYKIHSPFKLERIHYCIVAMNWFVYQNHLLVFILLSFFHSHCQIALLRTNCDLYIKKKYHFSFIPLYLYRIEYIFFRRFNVRQKSCVH